MDDPLGLHPGQINAPGNTRRFVHDGIGRLLAEITDLCLGGNGAGGIDASNPFNADGACLRIVVTGGPPCRSYGPR